MREVWDDLWIIHMAGTLSPLLLSQARSSQANPNKKWVPFSAIFTSHTKQLHPSTPNLARSPQLWPGDAVTATKGSNPPPLLSNHDFSTSAVFVVDAYNRSYIPKWHWNNQLLFCFYTAGCWLKRKRIMSTSTIPGHPSPRKHECSSKAGPKWQQSIGRQAGTSTGMLNQEICCCSLITKLPREPQLMKNTNPTFQ